MVIMIKKVIILVAGLGTPILPVNKAIPKELLLILDKSITQIAVEEMIEAGITTLVFVMVAPSTPLRITSAQTLSLKWLW